VVGVHRWFVSMYAVMSADCNGSSVILVHNAGKK
jgi:hypothetical protein